VTALADTRAITPTANAVKLSTAAGASVAALMVNLQQKLVEVRQLLAIIIALTPNGDSQISALNALLAELA
jgi:hypothetical protein